VFVLLGLRLQPSPAPLRALIALSPHCSRSVLPTLHLMGHPHQVQHHRRLGLFDSAPGQWQTGCHAPTPRLFRRTSQPQHSHWFTLHQLPRCLLAKGIIRPDGSPGPNALEAAQFMVTPPLPANYFISTSIKTPYSRYLPTPELGGAPNHAISLAELLAGVQSNPAGVQPHSIIRSPKRGWRRSSLPWSRPILICSAQGPLVPRDRPGSTHASPMPRCCRTRCSH
jgi:hypothetical protein